MLRRAFSSLLFRSSLLAAVLLLPPVGAHAQQAEADTFAPKGPIPHRNSEPLNTLFLAPLPMDASVLPRNRGRLGARLDIVNNLLTDTGGGKEYQTDFEEQRLYLRYAHGLSGGQEISLQFAYIARNGGFLDPVVNVWHKMFGLKGGGRENLPDYRILHRITNPDQQFIVNTDRGTSGLGDTVLEYRRALTSLPEGNDRPRAVAVTARGLLKIPTGSADSLRGSGGWDFGAGIALTARPDRRWAIHGNAALVFTSDPKIPNMEARGTLVHTMVATEYLLDGRTSLVFQTDDNPAPFRSGLPYPDRPRRAFTGGLWRQINSANRLYFSITENDFGPLAKHAPDFTMSLGAEWRL
jgi:hypothetical protein